MNDTDIEEHIAAEEGLRAQEAKRKSEQKAVAETPSGKAKEAVSAVGEGILSAVNPVHKDEQGNIDWGTTAVHSAADLAGIAAMVGAGAGLGKRAYNSLAGVDPTIAAQNERTDRAQRLAEQKFAFQQQQAQNKAAPKTAPVAPPKAPVVNNEGLVGGLFPPPAKAVAPIQPGVFPTAEQLIAQKVAETQQQAGGTSFPGGNPKVPPEGVNMITQGYANEEKNKLHESFKTQGHPLDTYVATQFAKEGLQPVSTQELSRISGIKIHDQKDAQKAIAKLSLERQQHEEFMKNFESELKTKPRTEAQIKNLKAIAEGTAPKSMGPANPQGPVAVQAPQHYNISHGIPAPQNYSLNPFNPLQNVHRDFGK